MFISGAVQSLSRVQLFVTLWTAECQASLSLTISQSVPKFMFIALLMLPSHLCFNELCFVLKSEVVVCKFLLASARIEIAGLGLLLISLVKAL